MPNSIFQFLISSQIRCEFDLWYRHLFRNNRFHQRRSIKSIVIKYTLHIRKTDNDDNNYDGFVNWFFFFANFSRRKMVEKSIRTLTMVVHTHYAWAVGNIVSRCGACRTRPRSRSLCRRRIRDERKWKSRTRALRTGAPRACALW